MNNERALADSRLYQIRSIVADTLVLQCVRLLSDIVQAEQP